MGFVEEGAEGKPFLVAALSPLRDVVLIDRPAFELFRHHYHDAGFELTPCDEAVSPARHRRGGR